MNEVNILNDNEYCCPECNALLETCADGTLEKDADGKKCCPNGCELIKYLD